LSSIQRILLGIQQCAYHATYIVQSLPRTSVICFLRYPEMSTSFNLEM